MTNNLTSLFKKIRNLKPCSDSYKTMKCLIVTETRQAKRDYFVKLQTKISSNPDAIWSISNRICNMKHKISPIDQLSVSESQPSLFILNKINAYFNEINSRYKPLPIGYSALQKCDSNCLSVSEISVVKALEKLNPRKSNVPGALPARFLKYASVIISPFLCHILNYSYETNTIPCEWKKGFITPVPKEINNITIDTLRPITQTNLFAKIMEGFMFQRLYDQVISNLSKSQFGAIRKSSTTHYLVSLFEFIFKALDSPNTYVILVLLDLSKAFDLVDHGVLIERLIELKVNKSDIDWLANFLTGRMQCTKHDNETSNFLPILNGTPQGTKLAIILFICLVDSLLESFELKHKSTNNIMNAFVDDMCIAEAVKYGDTPRIGDYTNDLCELLSKNKMVVNPKKSNVLIIDKSKSKASGDYQVEVNGVTIPRADCCKLLGVYINKKADWSDHIQHIYSKAIKKLYILRRLKQSGFLVQQLKKLYVSHIRSVLEYCCVLWCSNLTVEQSQKLVSVEKRALGIIVGKYVTKSNYLTVCSAIDLCPLQERWTKLLHNFGISTLKNDRYKDWLEKYKIHRSENHSSRYNNNKFNFRSVGAKCERYRRSTIPSLIRLLREAS